MTYFGLYRLLSFRPGILIISLCRSMDYIIFLQLYPATRGIGLSRALLLVVRARRKAMGEALCEFCRVTLVRGSGDPLIGPLIFPSSWVSPSPFSIK